jgi:hypothetical protein
MNPPTDVVKIQLGRLALICILLSVLHKLESKSLVILYILLQKTHFQFYLFYDSSIACSVSYKQCAINLCVLNANEISAALVREKGKAIPVTGREGPYGFETSRLPHFL